MSIFVELADKRLYGCNVVVGFIKTKKLRNSRYKLCLNERAISYWKHYGPSSFGQAVQAFIPLVVGGHFKPIDHWTVVGYLRNFLSHGHPTDQVGHRVVDGQPGVYERHLLGRQNDWPLRVYSPYPARGCD